MYPFKKPQAEWDEKKGMRGTNTITINGRLYDAATGLPVSEAALQQAKLVAPHAPKPSVPHTKGIVMSDVGGRPKHQQGGQAIKRAVELNTHANAHAASVTKNAAHMAPVAAAKRAAPSGAHQVHRRAQRSQTLHRATLKRPEPVQKAAQPVQRSHMIKKFAQTPSAQPEVMRAQANQQMKNISPVHRHQPAQTHPATQAHTGHTSPAHHAPQHRAHPAHPKKTEALKGKELKEQLIKEQMRHVDTIGNLDKKPSLAQRLRSKYPRTATVVTSISALVVLGGYLTYLNLPSLSIRVAAAQAGVAATYPSYQPSGYSFAGPVAFSPGEVRVKFSSNTNDYAYSLVQKDSTWDSQAVLDNYVLKETKQYATLQERGLTIYLMNNKAAWVNGGVLYTIEGNAPLSSEQIQKIASSTI